MYYFTQSGALYFGGDPAAFYARYPAPIVNVVSHIILVSTKLNLSIYIASAMVALLLCGNVENRTKGKLMAMFVCGPCVELTSFSVSGRNTFFLVHLQLYATDIPFPIVRIMRRALYSNSRHMSSGGTITGLDVRKCLIERYGLTWIY